MKAQPAVGVIPLGTGEMTKTTNDNLHFPVFFNFPHSLYISLYLLMTFCLDIYISRFRSFVRFTVGFLSTRSHLFLVFSI